MQNDNNTMARSPIRWAGSKRNLIRELLAYFPENRDIYIEPFLGSGTVLLNVLKQSSHTNFKQFFVNDINPNIVELFLLIKGDCPYFMSQSNGLINAYNKCKNLSEKENFYYSKRTAFNDYKPGTRIKPVVFYFLMKAGFNGVYRENLHGKFNVPFGKKEYLSNDVALIHETSLLIQNVRFFNESYVEFLDRVKKITAPNKQAFVYCDPPYLANDSAKNHPPTLYTKERFDHEAFMEYLKALKLETVISMSKSCRAMEIYATPPFKTLQLKSTKRIVNPKKLVSSEELIFKNF